MVDYFSPFTYGAVGNGVADDTAALQAAINAASTAPSAIEGPRGAVYAPPGYRFLTTAPLIINSPIKLYCGSYIYYQGASGAAVIVNSVAPAAGANIGFDLHFAGLRGIGGTPTGVNNAGAYGIEIRNMQFSKVRIDQAIAFTKFGIFLNATNDQYSGQQIQDNDFEFGLVADNGVGLYASSFSAAAGACQTNNIKIQNIFSNFWNIQLSDGTHIDTSDNTLFINAMDPPAPGGTAVNLYGCYNFFQLGYLYGQFNCLPGSHDNRVVVLNPRPTGATSYDAGTNNKINIPTS